MVVKFSLRVVCDLVGAVSQTRGGNPRHMHELRTDTKNSSQCEDMVCDTVSLASFFWNSEAEVDMVS